MMAQMLGENTMKCLDTWMSRHIGSSDSACPQILQSWMYTMTYVSSSVYVQTYKVSQYMYDGVDEQNDGNCHNVLQEGKEWYLSHC